MTKVDIIRNVHEKMGFSKRDSARLVEAVLGIMKENLARGEKIKISGFGNFVVKGKNARRGRNPKTGAELEISARKVLTFMPSQVLKRTLNEK